MLQCLEWEPTGSFYQKRPVELNEKLNENSAVNDHSGTSGLIDINLAVDMTDPTLPPNPRKAILYRPSVTHLIAVSMDVMSFLFLLQLCCSGVKVSLFLTFFFSGNQEKALKQLLIFWCTTSIIF